LEGSILTNFDRFGWEKIFKLCLGWLHEKHSVQHGILGTNPPFVLKTKKTTENLDRAGRLKELSDAY